MKIVAKGKLCPLNNNIVVINMNFDERKSAGGIVLPSDDGKSEGVRHRWGEVYAVGPEQTDVKPGDWILLEHGRWSRGFSYENPETGETMTIRRGDPNGILMVSDEKPDDNMLNTSGSHSKVSHATFDPGTFARPSFEQ